MTTNPATSSNPFIGLRSFEANESLLFFGRQEQTLELLKRLHQHHFVAVIGGSGSGKSSLVKAGLIPGLKAGYIVKSRDKWVIAIMRPGQSPMRNLMAAIIENLSPQSTTVDQLLQQLKNEGVAAIINILKPLWETHQTNFFLLVDQFEELFRFSLNQNDVQKKDEANEFVNTILLLSQQADLPIYVVITMRSDFIGDCAQFYGLPESLNQSQYLVPRLTRAQLKSTVESPIELYGGTINPNLTSKLLNDAQAAQDELPLLQHALMRIWQEEHENDKNGVLDINDYVRIGSLEKALSNHAEEAYKKAPGDDKPIIKKIFQALTTVDANARKIRRPAYLKQLTALTGATEEKILALVNRFVEGNRCFLMLDKNSSNPLIDISHESLIRRWSTLGVWVDEENESRKKLEKLIIFQQLDPKAEKHLLSEAELQQLLEWYNTFKPSDAWGAMYYADYKKGFEYLKLNETNWKKEQLKAKEEREAKIRNLVVGFSVALVLLISGFYVYQNIKERSFTNRKIESYLSSSEIAYSAGRDVKGMHLFAEALMLSNNADTIFTHTITRDTLLLKSDTLNKKQHHIDQILLSHKILPQFVLQGYIGQNARIDTAFVSSDGIHVITLNVDNMARYWEVGENRQVDSFKLTKAVVNSFSEAMPLLPKQWNLPKNEPLHSAADYYERLSSTWGIEAGLVYTNLGKGPLNYLGVSGVIGSNDTLVMIWGTTRESDFDAATLWSTSSGEQVGNTMFKELVENAFIDTANQHIYVYGDSSLQQWKRVDVLPNTNITMTADRDIPNTLFQLQVQAVSGMRLQTLREQLVPLLPNDWRKIYSQFYEEGAAHYKVCRYPKYNYWKALFSKE